MFCVISRAYAILLCAKMTLRWRNVVMTTLPCITARVGFDTQVLLQQAAAISGTSSIN
jgi:hypothetical protein